MRRITASLGSILLTLVLASCGGSDDDGPELAEIEVTPNPVTLAQQQTAQLQASVLNDAGQLVTGIAVTFASSNADVATVSNTGLVTAGHAGTASILVKGGGLTATVPVTVNAVSTAIVVSPNPGVVPQNGTLQLTAVVNDLAGLPIPGAPITFTSSVPGLATVSSSGLVDPVGPSGQVQITVTSGDLNTSVAVAITQVPTSVEVTPNPLTMSKNSTVRLVPTVRDFVNAPIPGVAASYVSSNITLATVGGSGLVSGKGQVGTLSIRVTASGLSVDVPVTLVDVGLPEGILDGTSSVTGQAYGIDISPTGLIVVSGTISSKATLSSRSFSELVGFVSGYQYAPAIALGGASAWISGVPDFGISEIDATTGATLGAVDGGNGNAIFMLRMSADGSRLYGSGPAGLLVVNTATRAIERNVPTSSAGLSLALNPIGSTVFVGGYGNIEEVNPSTGTVRFITGESNTNFAVSPDGQYLYLVFESDPAIKVVRVSDGAVTRRIDVGCGGWGVAVSPNGRKLFDSCGGTLVILDLLTDFVQRHVLGGELRRTAFSADGLTAAVTNTNGSVHFFR